MRRNEVGEGIDALTGGSLRATQATTRGFRRCGLPPDGGKKSAHAREVKRSVQAEEGADVDDEKVDAGRLVSVRDNEPLGAVSHLAPPREQLVRPVLGNGEGAHGPVGSDRGRLHVLARVELVQAKLVERVRQLGVPLGGAVLVLDPDVRLVTLLPAARPGSSRRVAPTLCEESRPPPAACRDCARSPPSCP